MLSKFNEIEFCNIEMNDLARKLIETVGKFYEDQNLDGVHVPITCAALTICLLRICKMAEIGKEEAINKLSSCIDLLYDYSTKDL